MTGKPIYVCWPVPLLAMLGPEQNSFRMPPPKIVKLAAHSPYLTMIKHGLPESDARPSSRSFFLFLFSARDSFCLFEAIFEKLNLNVKGRQAAERKGPTASSGS